MRSFLKKISNHVLIPIVRWYVRKKRYSRYGNLRVEVHPGVFHPGLFHSTHFLLKYLDKQNVSDMRVLELGCGTGLIAIFMAKMGAIVSASDINPVALQNAKVNADLNDVSISFFLSDLFQDLPRQKFDWIVINPPYYRRTPVTGADHAWNAGDEFQYFKTLFSQLSDFVSPSSRTIMILTENTGLEEILNIATENNWTMETLSERKSIFDRRDFIFRIRSSG